MMHLVPWLVVGLLVLVIAYEVLMVLLVIHRGREVAGEAVRYEWILPNAERRVLFVGDRLLDPFVQGSERYLACDKLHPNGDGYGLWYAKFTQRWISEEGHWLTERYQAL